MAAGMVLKHLENVSGGFLEEFRDLIAQHARGKCGIYVLYNKGQMYYVGLASNLNSRLNQHMKDRHKGKWDRFSIYITRNDRHMRELEALLHRVLRPEGNRQIGKLRGSEDLRRPLKRELRAVFQSRSAELMGDRVRAVSAGRSRVREPGQRSRGEAERPLAGWVERATALRATHKGTEFRARLRSDGTIAYKDHVFQSPSAAAQFILKRAANGWWFWQMRNENGEWVRLRELKA